jgi:hypothetical protein
MVAFPLGNLLHLSCFKKKISKVVQLFHINGFINVDMPRTVLFLIETLYQNVEAI